MRIILFCATERGYRFLQKIYQLAPEVELVVFSFKEEAWEPPFIDKIRQFTMDCGGQFFETKQVGAERWQELWTTTAVDLMFAVNWRYIIPARVYRQARLGAYVLHDSLLPAYRGFSPTVWALINGEDHTGVTLFEMVEAYDAGAIVGQEHVPISSEDTIATVTERVTEAYLKLIEIHLEQLMAGIIPTRPQDESLATYTCKLIPEDFRIDWSQTTDRIYNLIRATTFPYAGAYTDLNGQKLTIWEARKLKDAPSYIGRIPGRVIDIRAGEDAVVLTGDGVLLVSRVQLEGQDIVPAPVVLNRLSLTLGR